MSESPSQSASIESPVVVNLSSVLEPDADVLFTPLHDAQATLVHVERRAQFTLNETGADIWRWLSDKVALEIVAERLQETYEVDTERARASVLSLAQTLVAHGLCHVSESTE